ncbi:MAG TPA: CheR family methyltransferase [Candidatus Nanopelagicales bacterium]|nr:CheR family methyltransferase [Candidatus Nanopelagicales bacterium]
MTGSAPVVDRSPSLTDGEYLALTGFLAREAGLVFDVSRRAALAGVLTGRIAEYGAADAGAYLARISTPEGQQERQKLLDLVTIPETHFMRNPPQMAALRDRLLPELMRRAVSRGRGVTVWSAGCSSGEEPYTVAMLAATVAAGLPAVPPVQILATDVSEIAVAATTAATYTGRALGSLDEMQLARWFMPEPDGRLRVVPELTAMVSPRLHNLVTDPEPLAPGQADLIVCRNVTIYFARETMRELIARFHRVLAPGGYLLLGHAETLWKVTDAFTLVRIGDAFAYRKEQPAAPSVVDVADLERKPRTDRRRARRRVLPRAPARPAGPAVEVVVDTVPDPDAATSLLAQAHDAMGQAHYAQAARLAAQAAAASPFEVDAYVVEGRARATVGDDRGAVVALRKAVYLAPRAGHARFMLAGALARCGEHGGAAREYRAAAATLPTTDAAHLDGLLDGCSPDELVALCRRLADECERRVSQQGRGGGADNPTGDDDG